MFRKIVVISSITCWLWSEQGAGKSRTQIKTDEGRVQIADYKGEILHLDGDWRFANRNLTTIDSELFPSS
jgi:hypothetical protein